jgi:uncharacterized protein YggE
MLYKNLVVLSCGLLGCASSVLASEGRGSIILEGRGTAVSAPEFVAFSVTVTSLCYESSREAAEANAALANQVLSVFKGFVHSDRDKITASGGANVRQTETVYTGSTPKILCELKWRSENSLRLEMAQMTDLPMIQDQLVAALSDMNVTLGVPAQTYGEVSQPEFGLYPETRTKLRNEAQALAYTDARSQFDGLLSLCAFASPRVVSVSPPGYVFGSKLTASGAFREGASSPVIPDKMAVQATLKIEWAFTPSARCLE